jgi:hypothetical protein
MVFSILGQEVLLFRVVVGKTVAVDLFLLKLQVVICEDLLHLLIYYLTPRVLNFY